MSHPMLNLEGLRPVIEETANLAELFAARGKRLFLVGGAVRDLLLGQDLTAADLDFTTDALPEEIKQIVEPVASSLWTQGEKFGTIGCVIDGRGCEITTHRKEAYDHDSRKPAVVFGKDISEDLARRDFTINAIAVELPEGALADPFEGASALSERVLATPLSAEESFSDDPLRMLRAARFVTQFNLTPTEEVVKAMSEMGERLEIVSAERVTDEIEKTLLLEDPTAAFGLLASTGLSDRVFGERFAHRATAIGTRLAQMTRRLEPRLAGLAINAGLPGKPISAIEASLPGVLRFPKSVLRKADFICRDAQSLLQMLGSAGNQTGFGEESVKLVREWQVRALSSEPLLRDARRLAEAVAGERGLSEQYAGFEKLYEENDIASLKVPVSGDEIMEHLQLPPGPLVGEAIAHLTGVLIDQGQISKSEALEQVSLWWDERGRTS